MYMKAIIKEYDMKAAGPNCMLAEGHISQEFYDELMSIDNKLRRNIKLGYYLRDHNLGEARSKSYEKFINLFIEANKIPKEKILTIAIDAIWLIDCGHIEHTQFKNVEFRRDREATSIFVYKDNVFHYDSWSGDFFIRGFGEETSFTKEMKSLLGLLEMSDSKEKIYHQVHRINLMAKRGEIEYKTPKVTEELIDYMIEVLID